MRRAADAVLAYGPRWALIKGGHLPGRRRGPAHGRHRGALAARAPARQPAHPRHRLHPRLGDRRAASRRGRTCRRRSAAAKEYVTGAIAAGLRAGRAASARSTTAGAGADGADGARRRPAVPRRGRRTGTAKSRSTEVDRLLRQPAGAALRRAARQRETLPALMHEVQTLSRFGVRPTTARTRWMFGFQRRDVRRCECEMLLPKPGPLPQTSQLAATGHSKDFRCTYGGIPAAPGSVDQDLSGGARGNGPTLHRATGAAYNDCVRYNETTMAAQAPPRPVLRRAPPRGLRLRCGQPSRHAPRRPQVPQVPHDVLDAVAVRTWCGTGAGGARPGARGDRRDQRLSGRGRGHRHQPLSDRRVRGRRPSRPSSPATTTAARPRPALADAVRAMAHGALIGARGNSGTILAQLLRGMAEVLADATATAAHDATAGPARCALRRAADSAREAVAHPVEGTVLTVAARRRRRRRRGADGRLPADGRPRRLRRARAPPSPRPPGSWPSSAGPASSTRAGAAWSRCSAALVRGASRARPRAAPSPRAARRAVAADAGARPPPTVRRTPAGGPAAPPSR